jgi:predicted nuclease of predicted toxin-antitoxin system
VARFYTDENIPLQVVAELRRLGHDVLTSLDAGRANASVPDSEVLIFAAAQDRNLLSHNRRHFLNLHRNKTADHAGIVVCTFDPDFSRQTQQIHDIVTTTPEIVNQLLRVNRPAS